MKTINDYSKSKTYKRLLEIVQHNTSTAYGGVRLHDGTRNYMQQVPEEFAALITFLCETFGKKPVKFLEVGTASNVTNSLFWDFLKIQENVIIDNLALGGIAQALVGNLAFKEGTVLLVGGSQSEKIKSKVKQLGLTYDLMFIDGCHDYPFVKNDFESYASYLNVGGYIGFHDTCSTRCPDVARYLSEISGTRSFKSSWKHVAEFRCKDYFFDAGIGVYQRIK